MICNIFLYPILVDKIKHPHMGLWRYLRESVMNIAQSSKVPISNYGGYSSMFLFLASGHGHVYFCGVPAKVHMPIF